MTRLRDSIKNALGVVWPVVRDRMVDAIEPTVAEKLERSVNRRSGRRFVVEETIEQIAAAGLLRTPTDADVIGKAVAWHESFGDQPPSDDQDEDIELYDAVEKLLDETEGRPGV